ncbi:regulatory-associated protein of mTOR-like isoform X2 [Tubulanus polymorphus]|uniref:regulatory-associated protein of mTOR-like isoform X2 n=1 Tax=Tubulanus polymorphus TaxID=672921 RepID=UPI003DA6A934
MNAVDSHYVAEEATESIETREIAASSSPRSMSAVEQHPDSVIEDNDSPESDWKLFNAFTSKRHLEKIEGIKTLTHSWRMKDRMKTVSVALVLCLNVGVDPPDVVKTSPCARMECWIDPLSMSPQKSLEAIGANLQKQYERWQPRARYKQSLDPTVEEVKKLCTSLRRNAKEERVLFHYNGHGVPKPTMNGEIWVFNKTYTQYIPLSVYDLQTWMLCPSIYVYDCSNAGVIIESFKQFQLQREQEIELAMMNNRTNGQTTQPVSVKNCIQLAACSPNELLPMNPELPADLFTSCLTTPIKIALRWYVLQNTKKLVPGISLELIEKIPGQLNDRRTMLGELNWIFTAITDTIAWNTLPRDLFQKLFRQDLLVASLFRNFLLAERIMRSYNCTPVSNPKLPPTYQHSIWQAWDLTLDLCLSQLPAILDEGATFRHSPFFAEQLTAFQVWLSYGSEARSPPEQLPIVLQVLLSQVHRLRALELLGRFLDLGPWAVSLALSVGIFPYVLKLLQSSARELRPLLVFIWAKILAVDTSCQADLVKDNGHKYFLQVLADPYMPSEHRTMAAFVLAIIVNDYPTGQEAALQGSLIAICLEHFSDSQALLRQWLTLCLAKIWTNFDAARWTGVRNSAQEKIYELLKDPEPEVRAAGVHALGSFVNNSGQERTDHANTIDHGVGMTLLSIVSDGSPFVRQELVVALAGLVMQFENSFTAVAYQLLEEERQNQNNPVVAAVAPGGWNVVSNASTENLVGIGSTLNVPGIKKSSSRSSLKGMLTASPSTGMNPLSNLSGSGSFDSSSGSAENLPVLAIKRVASASSISSMLGASYSNIYTSVWKHLLQLTNDPHPRVHEMAKSLVNTIKLKATTSKPSKAMQLQSSQEMASLSAPSSPSNKPVTMQIGDTPPKGNGFPLETERAYNKLNFNYERRGSRDLSRPLYLDMRRGSMQVGMEDVRKGLKGPVAAAANLSHTPYSAQFSRSRKIFDKGPSMIDEKDEDLHMNQTKHQVTVSTEFFPWCCKHFSESVMRLPDNQDTESRTHHNKSWRYERNAKVRSAAKSEQRRAGFNRLDDQIFINRNQFTPTVIKFHPYETYMAVADKEGVSMWEWEQGTRVDYLVNHNPKNSRITAMDFINAHDKSLLLVGSDDGSVRIWRDYCSMFGSGQKLVTAWQALSDMLPSNRGSGLVLNWEQQSGILLASGDVRHIRVWDVQKELKVQDIPTGADSCVTSLTCDSFGQSLMIAGCGDGSVRLYDRRLSSAECRVMTLREHSGWVVKVHLQKSSVGKIISASVGGDVRFWDPRFAESVKTISTSQGLTALEIHQFADVLSCGYLNQLITVFNQSGDTLSTIKYHDGFMGQRIGPISCMAFHPYRVKLAAGSTDGFISVYSTSEWKR